MTIRTDSLILFIIAGMAIIISIITLLISLSQNLKTQKDFNELTHKLIKCYLDQNLEMKDLEIQISKIQIQLNELEVALLNDDTCYKVGMFPNDSITISESVVKEV